MLMIEQNAEKARIVKVLVRHHFVTVGDSDQGFCAGPYCAGGITTVATHAAHLADTIMRVPPASTPEDMCWCGEHPARFDHVGCDDDCPEDCMADHRGEQ